MYTRMHGEFGEFFLEFFDLKISIYRFFFFSGNRFQRQFLDSRHLPYVCIVLQFLDKSSNLKAGCKKDAIYDAFDTIYVSYSHISRRNILCNFFQSCPVIYATVRSLPPESALL